MQHLEGLSVHLPPHLDDGLHRCVLGGVRENHVFVRLAVPLHVDRPLARGRHLEAGADRAGREVLGPQPWHRLSGGRQAQVASPLKLGVGKRTGSEDMCVGTVT